MSVKASVPDHATAIRAISCTSWTPESVKVILGSSGPVAFVGRLTKPERKALVLPRKSARKAIRRLGKDMIHAPEKNARGIGYPCCTVHGQSD